MDEAAARIGGQLPAEREQPLLVPLDHFGQCIDHDQRSQLRIFQRRQRGVTEPEAADHDIETGSRQRRQSEPRQFDFG